MDGTPVSLEGALVEDRVHRLRAEACHDAVARRAARLLACCAPLWRRTAERSRRTLGSGVAWLRHGQLGPLPEAPCVR